MPRTRQHHRKSSSCPRHIFRLPFRPVLEGLEDRTQPSVLIPDTSAVLPISALTGLNGEWYDRNDAPGFISSLAVADQIMRNDPVAAIFRATTMSYAGSPLGTMLGVDAPSLVPTSAASFGSSPMVTRYTGYITIEASHDANSMTPEIDVHFRLDSDDGARLVIGGQTIAANNGIGVFIPGAQETASFAAAGTYPIEVVWYDHFGGIQLHLRSSIGAAPGAFSLLPSSLLSSPAIPDFVRLVTNTADSGSGSLRQAILDANAATGPVEIRFMIPTTDPNFVDVDSALSGGDAAADVSLIQPLSALPSLNNPLAGIRLDARTQTTLIGNTNPFGPEVVLDGNLARVGVNGLTVLSNTNQVFGLNIQRFGGSGIEVIGGDNNWIAGNYIGTTATGTAAPATRLAQGVFIRGGATFNCVGTNGDGVADEAECNVISGSLFNGVPILDSGTDANIVAGNYIGTDWTGTVAIGNGHAGVTIQNGARFNRVGTNSDGVADDRERNVIAASGFFGVSMGGNNPDQNIVAGNYIGTDWTGTIALGNTQGGVDVNSRFNTIGGLAQAARNVISGNLQVGVQLRQASNTVLNNYIGTDVTGTIDLGNSGDGMRVVNAPNNTIGGPAAGAGNVISGNNGDGIEIMGSSATGNVVAGNFIGTNAAGTAAVPNGGTGVNVINGASQTRIGTNADGVNDIAERNVISGNGHGIVLADAATTGNRVLGNSIGTNAAGNAAIGNLLHNVRFNNSGGNIVGAPGAGNVIAGSTREGVWMEGAATVGNVIQANFIGTNAAGAAGLGNREGIGTHPSVGGNTIEGNVVSGNNSTGMSITGPNFIVRGNVVGLNPAGTAKLPNIGHGIFVSSANNAIGGMTAAQRNVISGNTGVGVLISGTGATRNVVQGNYIGTNAAGTASLGNFGQGVGIAGGASNNIIGGSTAAARNLISGNNKVVIGGNLGRGVEINGATTTGNRLFNNYIGMDVTGNVALDNGGDGVSIVNAPGNLVGGAGMGNLISGNGRVGVYVVGATATGNVLAGNLIGTNATGTAAIPNGAAGLPGVMLDNAPGNLVGTNGDGTDDALERNVISGNVTHGVLITGVGSTGNVVAGNHIGTNAAGTAALGNSRDGVVVTAGAANNTIGGLTATPGTGAGNVISGNSQRGIQGGGGNNNQYLGNIIGLNAAGTAALGNAFQGIEIFGGAGNAIGGTAAGSRNVISANGGGHGGILLAGATNTVVQGNYIGTDITGTLDRGNAVYGIEIVGGSNNTVGGTAAAARNVVSGNNSHGIFIANANNFFGLTAPATGNVVQGNYIGTDVNGSADLGNSLDGVNIGGSGFGAAGSAGNTIGGSTVDAGNLISGNNSDGIEITSSGSNNNVVAGNYIGTNAAGTSALGNAVNGVQIDGGAANNIIGGGTSAARNLISGNGLDGVFIIAATDNRVQGNYIGSNAAGSAAVANARIGILLWPGAAQNIIGTDGNGVADATEGNLVSGNGTHGIEIRGAGSNQNVVAGNLVGTDLTGTVDLGNGAFGVFVWEGAQNNRVGTDRNGVSDAVERNVISGNAFGVFLRGTGTTGNTVAGNLIGTNLAGTASLGNSAQGVAIVDGASNNIIGGTSTAARNLISGNNSHGVEISGGGTNGNLVVGNHIGTDVTGTSDLGNGLDGVLINGSSNNTVGGTTATARNVISGNNGVGVRVQTAGATGNLIQNNSIGTDASGAAALGNSFAGVFLAAGTQTSSILDNVISGNGTHGVRINGASSNVVAGNRIGTNEAGSDALGNLSNGVLIDAGAVNNTIGGATAADCNLISGNGDDGIEIGGSGSTGNIVAGNYVGTDAGGTVDLGNLVNGVRIADGASNNTIGGAVVGARNVISGNDGNGIQIVGSGSNVIAGNYIGLNADGTGALGNINGVRIDTGAIGNRIGTDADGVNDDLERNVISGNNDDGIDVSLPGTNNNVIAGNYIGTTPDGTAALGNLGRGVRFQLGASNNTVGGSSAAARNIISGNSIAGVLIRDSGTNSNVVVGNYIGTNVTGTAALANLSDGVRIDTGASNNRIGTDANGANDAAERNVISGNVGNGVYIFGIGTAGNTVAGNSVGTNAAGTAALANVQGVYVDGGAANNLVGGTAPGAGNLISGNTFNGVVLISGAAGNQVLGNTIGTDWTGTLDLGNHHDGVHVRDAANNTIGSAAAGGRNLISGNDRDGVRFRSGATANVLAGNWIGTDITGTLAVPNQEAGVNLVDLAHDNRIGTDGDGVNDDAEANTIAFNSLTGVTVSGAGTVGNSIRRNSIHSNGGLGIDLDSSGNNAQAAPVVTAAVPGVSTSVAGNVIGAANITFTVEVFANDVADPSGFGEGKRYLGKFTVTTDAAGNAAFSVILSSSTVAGEFITATTTDPSGNTSAFSAAVAAEATTEVLSTAVTNLLATGTINGGQANSMLSKLDNVQKKVNTGNINAAINQLNAFINHVTSLVAEGVLTEEEAELLLYAAQLLIDELDG